MRFKWDEAKNHRNLAKHRISFETAKLVFEDPHHLSVQDRVVEGEERWQTFGMIDGATLLVVAHAYWEEDSEEVIRMISARKATRQERRAYEEAREESV
jgi:uncharacterized DUF497 family protein